MGKNFKKSIKRKKGKKCIVFNKVALKKKIFFSLILLIFKKCLVGYFSSFWSNFHIAMFRTIKSRVVIVDWR